MYHTSPSAHRTSKILTNSTIMPSDAEYDEEYPKYPTLPRQKLFGNAGSP